MLPILRNDVVNDDSTSMQSPHRTKMVNIIGELRGAYCAVAAIRKA